MVDAEMQILKIHINLHVIAFNIELGMQTICQNFCWVKGNQIVHVYVSFLIIDNDVHIIFFLGGITFFF